MAERTGSRGELRKGFSTGTAMTAAARAALKCLLGSRCPEVIAVRLPLGFYLPVGIERCSIDGASTSAVVVKDGGDDPDVTDGAEIHVRVCAMLVDTGTWSSGTRTPAVALSAGRGVGIVTKPGLPVAIGEPAVNPVPRQMLADNLGQELVWNEDVCWSELSLPETTIRNRTGVFLHLPDPAGNIPKRLLIEATVEVPRGEVLARHTLNPRLGIQGGISILGTTGIVKPFSHQAYEETIASALDVAKANRCERVVLSTGGKSEKAAQGLLPAWPPEAFVQIADFFGFAVRKTAEMEFLALVHSVFFGKVVKMAQGHAYTHAHKVPLSLVPVAEIALELGYDTRFAETLAKANTARHALRLLYERGAVDILARVAEQAVEQSKRLAKNRLAVGLFLFDYDGQLLFRMDPAR